MGRKKDSHYPNDGRPTKFKDEYCGELIKHMAQGYSFPSFAGKIGVCEDTIYEWVTQHENFSEAKKLGLAQNLLFMEELGMEGLTSNSKDFNNTMWIFQMKNRHPKHWRDRQEVKLDADIKTETYEEYIDRINREPEKS